MFRSHHHAIVPMLSDATIASIRAHALALDRKSKVMFLCLVLCSLAIIANAVRDVVYFPTRQPMSSLRNEAHAAAEATNHPSSLLNGTAQTAAARHRYDDAISTPTPRSMAQQCGGARDLQKPRHAETQQTVSADIACVCPEPAAAELANLCDARPMIYDSIGHLFRNNINSICSMLTAPVSDHSFTPPSLYTTRGFEWFGVLSDAVDPGGVFMSFTMPYAGSPINLMWLPHWRLFTTILLGLNMRSVSQ
jgi:hypothetical protein